MKGGITSGVVYPKALSELAKEFRFKNIGGTSAGAIAAAAAAAAECGRRSGEGGFEELEELPEQLGERVTGTRTRLFEFFQPQPQTKQVFDTLVAGLRGGWTAPLRLFIAACWNFFWALLIGITPGLVLVIVAFHDQDRGALFYLAVIAGIGGIFLGIFFSVCGVLLWRLLGALPANYYGLCTGMPCKTPTANKAESLTPWLHRYLNRLAGRSADGPPLTFGHLWGRQNPNGERDINLEMMTTCLTHGRPYRLPFRDDQDVHESKLFSFKPEEFRKFFPEEVVKWMEQHARPSDHPERFAASGVTPLPEPWNMPVVVAVRMSLSFPILLSAVPLYAIDFSRTNERDQVPERCWFSDGGICSNFPLHFFDAPLPRWPTFCIDLCDKHPDADPKSVNKPTMAMKNSDEIAEAWDRFDQEFKGGRFVPKSRRRQLLSFLETVIHTMQNWTDNTQSRLPGFRDRIAHVSLTSEEGGLNLDMPVERITALSERGRAAGRMFVERFGPTQVGPMNWNNHRWVRYRTAIGAIEEMLLRIHLAWTAPQQDDVPYEGWVAGAPKPPSYKWTPSQNSVAAELTRSLVEAAKSWATTNPSLGEGAPRPRPEIRLRPRI
jgi:predicted acylesterase/phospholipase RssA